MGKQRFMVAAAAAATVFGGAAANANNPFELRIRGYVPVICRATVDAAVVSSDADFVPLGELNEFCNNANGYEVWVDYSPELEASTLMVDSHAVSLTGSGSVRISQTSHPAIQSRSLALQAAGDDNPNGWLTVRVVAL